MVRLSSDGLTRLRFDSPANDLSWANAPYLALWAAAGMVYNAVTEYYWHRLMHTPFFYQRLHKIHHFHKL